MKSSTVAKLIVGVIALGTAVLVGFTVYDIYRTATGQKPAEATVSRAIPTCAIRGHKGGCVAWK